MRGLHLPTVPLAKIEKDLLLIKEQGFDYVQISNLTPTKSEEGNHDWWKLYQPMSFKIGNYLGGFEDLKRLCTKAHELGLKISYDVVIRHCANGEDNNTLQPHPSVELPKRILENKDCWLEKIQVNYGNRFSETHYCTDLPALNYDHRYVVCMYYEYFKQLHEAGVDLLRVDQAKHFALPSEHSGFWNFFRSICEEFGFQAYGEMIQASHELMDKYVRETNLLLLTDAQWYWDKYRTVVMAYSHDHAWTWNMHVDNEHVIRGWQHICKHFPNTLFFSEDMECWKDSRVKEANQLQAII